MNIFTIKQQFGKHQDDLEANTENMDLEQDCGDSIWDSPQPPHTQNYLSK